MARAQLLKMLATPTNDQGSAQPKNISQLWRRNHYTYQKLLIKLYKPTTDDNLVKVNYPVYTGKEKLNMNKKVITSLALGLGILGGLAFSQTNADAATTGIVNT